MTSSWEKQKNGWKPPQVPTQTKFTLHEAIASRVTSMPVRIGFQSGPIELGTDFLYLDHPYFGRGWNRFRAVRGMFHLTHVLKRHEDRLRRFGVEPKPWRRSGTRILVLKSSERIAQFAPQEWLENTLGWIKSQTDRPIIIKEKGDGELQKFLRDCWAVVAFSTRGAVDAAIHGIPVFSSPMCASWPVHAGNDIEKPELKDRHEWLCSLAYATWDFEEIDSVDWNNYIYARRHDLP